MRADHNSMGAMGTGMGEPVGIPPSLRVRFELKTALVAGGSAEAYMRVWNGTGYATTAIVITVYDVIGSYSGPVGAYGAATRWGDSTRFEIDDLQCT